MDTASVELKNPVTVMRERLGINRRELAHRTGCGYGILSHAELGYDPNLPSSIVKALDSLGMPPGESMPMYVAWRETLRGPGLERTAQAAAA